MYIIKKAFAFEAAHHLEGLPPTHKCSRPHGHSYRVEIELQSETLNDVGFVVDYADLDEFGDHVKRHFDHRDLNYVYPFNDGRTPLQTSAENIARFIYEWCKERWPQVSRVRVSETAKTWAEYTK